MENNKTPAVLVALAAIAAVLVTSTVAIGTQYMAFAGNVKNTGINVPTDTQQKQVCETASGNSPVSNSCTGASTDTITQSGGALGELKK